MYNFRIIIVFALIFVSGLSHAIQPEEIVQIKEGIKGKVIFFMGYPGSGKGTQGKILQEILKVPHVSTGELFRAEAETKSKIGLEMAGFMNSGAIIPSQITFDYLEMEFGKEKYKNGFILDGYPKNVECYDFIIGALKRKNLELLSVIHFDISRNETQRRLTERLLCAHCELGYQKDEFDSKDEASCQKCKSPLEIRKDDNPQAIQKRLDSFEESTLPLYEIYKGAGVLRTIPVASSREEMTERVLQTLKQDIERNRALSELPQSSYFLRPLKEGEKENSSVFHNHLDAQDHLLVRNMIYDINKIVDNAQNKIYPISFLLKGPQTQEVEFREVYENLPNFHSITDSKHEAFATGKMGDSGINYEQTLATLNIAFSHPKQGVMTEIEEDIYGFNVTEEGQIEVQLNRGNTADAIDWARLPGWKEKMIKHVPKFELHHGFDIDKTEGETTPPICLTALMEATSKAGFHNGGWFIFSKEKQWAFRSNEFSNQDYNKNVETLVSQARQLREIIRHLMPKNDVRKVPSSASLEKVHAIWQIQ